MSDFTVEQPETTTKVHEPDPPIETHEEPQDSDKMTPGHGDREAETNVDSDDG